MKIEINFDKTVAFDIDAMNGFTPLCPDELPVKDGDKIVDGCLQNHTKAKFKVMSKDAHPPKAEWSADEDNPQFSKVGLPNVDIRWNNHCRVGTFGFQLIDGLPHVTEYDFLVYKGVEKDMHPYSPIYHDLDKKISTGVIEWATVKEIDTFIIGGLAFDYCVKQGVIDLCKAGFRVIVNLSATKSISGDMKTHLLEMESHGAIFIENTDILTIKN